MFAVSIVKDSQTKDQAYYANYSCGKSKRRDGGWLRFPGYKSVEHMQQYSVNSQHRVTDWPNRVVHY